MLKIAPGRRLKWKINQALGASGYSLVRKDTLARLVAEAAQKPAAAQASDPDPAPAQALDPDPTSAPDRPPDPDPATETAPLPQSNFKLLPALNQAPSRCTALAPKFGPSKKPRQLEDQIAEFQQKGIALIGTSAEKAVAWRDTEIFDRDTGNHHPAWDWAGPDIKPYTEDLRIGIPSTALVEDLHRLFSGGDFEAFFQGVLGCPAKIANVRLVKSIPHLTEGIGPQEWHNDGCPAGVIRGVLYLTDVDLETGPFQYRDETGSEHTVFGKAGDLLIFDAMRLVHRALPPTRHVRTAIDLIFMPRMPDEKLQIMVVGLNHWPADPFFYAIPEERIES